jgi:hypothetical protein
VAFPAIVNVSSHEPRTIIGVVSDAIHSFLREPRRPALYELLAQNDWPSALEQHEGDNVDGALPGEDSRTVLWHRDADALDQMA